MATKFLVVIYRVIDREGYEWCRVEDLHTPEEAKTLCDEFTQMHIESLAVSNYLFNLHGLPVTIEPEAYTPSKKTTPIRLPESAVRQGLSEGVTYTGD